MTFLVWLVLLMGTDPVPTLGVLKEYNSVFACEQDKKHIVEEQKLDASQATRLQCLPIVTSKLSDPT